MKDFITSDHYTKIDRAYWDMRWPNFTPRELASPDDGSIVIQMEALDKLQKLRNNFGKPLLINSAYRTAAHNKAVGGSKKSQHLFGKAFDISLRRVKGGDLEYNADELDKIALEVGFMGIGRYDKFIHVDNRTTLARWDLRSGRNVG